ncbi:hypothetical protein [Clostridium formicaceticum]|uniref:Uncharacterized protein n=1 Tax=Clostridium formicaceticum TaxID=1497 RepID=A0AAC9WEM5_9CLOT|nr:hypothetical protein [Clostridium formicaceticum]AOY75495.1 hypothetical protein BJL90_06040 [Clostridium formicaceticum]ARE85783.1 hypothetical protein CLFO_00990 [Clostridium formicaceticum]
MYNNPTHYPYAQYPYHGIPEGYMEYYDDRSGLIDLYPDVYQSVYPRVQEICGRYDLYNNPRMYPQVDSTLIQQMVDEVYQLSTNEVEAEQWGPRGAFRDLITILIIRELLARRRRRPFPGFPPRRPRFGYFY